MNIDPKIVQELVNFVSRHNGLGNQDESLFNIMWGLNNLNPGINLPYNTERYGYIFLTRPDLNLSYNNICDNPYLAYLLDTREDSVLRAIRIMLDGDSFETVMKSGLTKSKLFNNKSPFLNIITNSAISMSGWRDISMDTYTSKEGRRKESWTIADGITDFMGMQNYSIACRSVPGDVILKMLEFWLHYMSYVRRGTVSPKPENLWQRRIDYTTRIFAIKTDESRVNIIRLSSTGPGFPLNAPTGAATNFAIDQPFNQENDQITINFACNGERHNHMGLVEDFNYCVAMRNPQLAFYLPANLSSLSKKGTGYRKLTVPEVLSNIYNYYATPLIHPATVTLEWWIEESEYARIQELSSESYIDALIKDATDSLTTVSENSSDEAATGYFENISRSREKSIDGDELNGANI